MNKNSASKVRARADSQSPLTRQFKSPISRSLSSASDLSENQLKEQIEALQKTLQETDSEIKQLTAKGYRESELQTHIDKLHEYNEIKDVGQMVLGRIADLEGLQTKNIYERYGLGLND